MEKKKELNSDELKNVDGGIDVRKDDEGKNTAVWIGGDINPDNDQQQK